MRHPHSPVSTGGIRCRRRRGGIALAETVNGLYETELIRGPDQGPWRTVDDVELVMLGWVHWHSRDRLHGYCGDVPPAEFEAQWLKRTGVRA